MTLTNENIYRQKNETEQLYENVVQIFVDYLNSSLMPKLFSNLSLDKIPIIKMPSIKTLSHGKFDAAYYPSLSKIVLNYKKFAARKINKVQEEKVGSFIVIFLLGHEFGHHVLSSLKLDERHISDPKTELSALTEDFCDILGAILLNHISEINTNFTISGLEYFHLASFIQTIGSNNNNLHSTSKMLKVDNNPARSTTGHGNDNTRTQNFYLGLEDSKNDFKILKTKFYEIAKLMNHEKSR